MTKTFATYMMVPKGGAQKRMRVLPEAVEGALIENDGAIEVGLILADDSVVALTFPQVKLLAKLFKDYADLQPETPRDATGRKFVASMGVPA